MKLSIIGLAFGLVALCASTAYAQGGGRPERPYRGLFGGGVGIVEQSLIFNGAVGGGYDDNILLDQPGGTSVDPRAAQSGGLGMLNGSLNYSVEKDRVSGGVSLGSSSRYYPGQEQEFVGAHSASAGINLRVGMRTTLTGQQAISYQPYTFASVLPLFSVPALGQVPDPALDFATGSDSYIALTSSAGLSHRFSQRTAFNASYNYQDSETAFDSSRFSRQGATAGMQFTLTQGLGLRAGYSYQTGTFASDQGRMENHNIDLGIDFRKALSFSRRTMVTFSTGTAAVSDGNRTTYRATGSARLNHEMGRTWLANATYDRSVQLADVLLEPVFQDAFGAGVGGLLHRRLQFQSAIRASVGTIGFGGGAGGNDFDTYLASAGLGFALSRYLIMNLDYGFYHYRFDRGIALPSGIARNIDRHTIRASIGVWAPLFSKARR
jgi:hypothetical protein